MILYYKLDNNAYPGLNLWYIDKNGCFIGVLKNPKKGTFFTFSQVRPKKVSVYFSTIPPKNGYIKWGPAQVFPRPVEPT